MAHISSLGAGIFTYLDIFKGTIPANTDTVAECAALFVGGTPGTADADHVRMPSVREFPSIGTPANIVNVPVYGQKTSSQVQGQADAPTLEVTVNYNAGDMQAIAVDIRIDRHRGNAHFLRCSCHPSRNFTAVGNQNFFKHLRSRF